MPDLQDGESTEMQGSGSKPYILKNTGGIYSCTCPAWRNQSIAIEKRSCKHLRKLRGDAAEESRTGGALPQRPTKTAAEGGEEDAGPPLLLAESWDNAADLAGWWMSEKLDGVRAYWDGEQFLSRQGNIYHAPDWFIEGLPSVPLDGELWIDRKKFQRTVSIVRRQDKSDLWNEVRFLIFDAPAATGGFEDRLGFLKDALGPRASGGSNPFYMLGLITYPLYLIHQDLGFILLRAAPSALNRVLLLCTVMAAMVVMAWLLHIGPEKWLAARLKSFLMKPQEIAGSIMTQISERLAGGTLKSTVHKTVIPTVVPARVSSLTSSAQTSNANPQLSKEGSAL